MNPGRFSSPLYPELEAYLAGIERNGIPVVPMKGPRSRTPRPWTRRRAAQIVADARKKAGLPAELTRDACRHGGITALTDAGATEGEGMASSGHASPDAFRRYAKPTEAQRMNAARKRRAWIATDAAPAEEAPAVAAPARPGRKTHPRRRAAAKDA